MNVADRRMPKGAARLSLPDQAGAPSGVRLSLSAPRYLDAWPRMRAVDMALLEITFDQIRRRLDTHTVDIVTGKKMPNP